MTKILSFWADARYYKIAKEASTDASHAGMRFIKKIADQSKSILDIGCGEGTRLNFFCAKNQDGVGIDISAVAIKLAKAQFSKLKFFSGDFEKLRFSEKFDLVYSAFVIEHVSNPVKLLERGLQLTKIGGVLVILAPNFGAPNRRSPNSMENPLSKLMAGLAADFSSKQDLDWTLVTPKSQDYNQVDDDALCEPYLGSLIKYFQNKPVEIIKIHGFWELEPWSCNPRKSLFKLLGILGLYPFRNWGPQLLIAVKKIDD